MAKNTGRKITDILKDPRAGHIKVPLMGPNRTEAASKTLEKRLGSKKKKKRSGPSSRTEYTGPKLKPKLGGSSVRNRGTRSKSLSDTHREAVEERKRNQGENKAKRTGHSKSGPGGGYVDLMGRKNPIGVGKGSGKYRLRIEPKL